MSLCCSHNSQFSAPSKAMCTPVLGSMILQSRRAAKRPSSAKHVSNCTMSPLRQWQDQQVFEPMMIQTRSHAHSNDTHHFGYESMRIWRRVITKIKSFMLGRFANPLSVRPHIPTAWFPAISCSTQRTAGVPFHPGAAGILRFEKMHAKPQD
jgi:hypothetical protein